MSKAKKKNKNNINNKIEINNPENDSTDDLYEFQRIRNENAIQKRNSIKIIDNYIVIGCVIMCVVVALIVYMGNKRRSEILSKDYTDNIKVNYVKNELDLDRVTSSSAVEGQNTEESKADGINYENSIICWGDAFATNIEESDSFFSFYIAENISNDLSSKIENVFSAGSVSDNILSVAGKQGTIHMWVNSFKVGDKNERVKVVLKSSYDNSEILLDPYYNSGLNPCKIAGVEGMLSSDGKANYFTPLNDADKGKTIARGETVFTNAMTEMQGHISVYFFGKTYKASSLETTKIYERMIKALGNDRYIIVGALDTTERDWATYDTAFSNAFGRHYINLNTYLTSTVFDDYEINIKSEDIQALKSGQVPSVFLANENQLSEIGAKVVGDVIYKRMQELGITKGDK